VKSAFVASNRNKYEVAAAVIEQFPELASRRPGERKIWKPEDYVIKIFDAAAFVQPDTGRGFYGNSARDILTGPGAQTWNTVLAKNFALREQVRLQFRWEMFNAFNRPNFGNPSTNISGGDFGLVTYAGNMRKMLFGLRLDY